MPRYSRHYAVARVQPITRPTEPRKLRPETTAKLAAAKTTFTAGIAQAKRQTSAKPSVARAAATPKATKPKAKSGG